MTLFTRIFILATCLSLGGCSLGSKSFYMLTADGTAPAISGQGLGVGPVLLAEYIDRPNLVVAESANQLGIAENHRWAGDLASSISRVTAANLGRRLHTGNIRTYPWKSDEGMRYQVTLDIRQLHGGSDGHALIEAGWTVYRLPEKSVLAAKTFVDREPLESDGYPALVAAQSRLLSRLADDVAKSIQP